MILLALIFLIPIWRIARSKGYSGRLFVFAAGIPASSANFPNRSAVNGESSDILRIAVLPSARQGATFQVAVIKGTFHGDIRPQTPTGS